MARSNFSLAIPENLEISASGARDAETEIDFRTPGTYSVNGRYSLLRSTIGFSSRGLGPVGNQDSHLSLAVIQAPDGTIRID